MEIKLKVISEAYFNFKFMKKWKKMEFMFRIECGKPIPEDAKFC